VTEILGHYRILERLGEGGMGEVYRAVDTRLGREVAVKMLPAAYAHDDQRRRRLEREARAASALNHPNIVTIHDVGSEGGRTFIVMELVRGMTLAQLIPPEGLEMRLALQYAQQVASALQRAHAAGVIHRDIKPGNVMVTSEGLVKVMDFGLARMGPFATDGQTHSRQAVEGALTEEGATLGTFAYMSPEQARGEPLDERSEIFSFGILLYEMLAGRRPFAGNNPYSTLEAICRMDPPSLGELRLDLPTGPSRLVRRCLAKSPDERHQSFADIVEELRALQAASSSGPLLLAPHVAWRPDRPASPSSGVPPRPSSVGSGPAAERTPSGQAAERPVSGEVPASSGAPRTTPTGSQDRGPETGRSGPEPGARSLEPVVDRRGKWAWVGILLAAVAVAAIAFALMSGRRTRPGLSPQVDAPSIAAANEKGSAASAYEKVTEGRALLDRDDRPGNVDRAQVLFEEACRAQPAYAPAYAGLAEALWRQVDRDPDKAVLNRGLEAARKAVALEDQMASAHAVLGLLLTKAGEQDRAGASIARALELDPKSRDALLAMSDLQMARGDAAAAEGTARKAVELHPDDWRTHSNLGYMLYRQSRFAEAAASFERTLEHAPDSVRTLSNLAGLYHMLGRTGDAATTLQKAIAIAPSSRTYNNLGTLRFFQGRYEESMQLFEKAVELSPNTYVHWGNLGDARRWAPGQEGRAAEAYATAIGLVRKHLEATPDDRSARASLATYLVKTGRTAEALAELARAEGVESADHFYSTAVVLEVAGQRDRALSALDSAVALGYSPTEIEADPELTALRRDRRFLDLMRKHQRP